MEKVFFVKKGNLEEVNEELAKGGTVKMVSAVSESIAGGGDSINWETGAICAYIVVVLP